MLRQLSPQRRRCYPTKQSTCRNRGHPAFGFPLASPARFSRSVPEPD
jgi:hypothetical protein